MTGFPETTLDLDALEVRVAILEAANSSVYSVGDFKLFPFRASALPPKFYFPNGDRYNLSTPQGQALYGLSTTYKADWGITVSNDTINLPDLFASDGRGYFFRAAAVPGLEQGDAIREISGDVCFTMVRNDEYFAPTGAFSYRVETASRLFDVLVNAGYKATMTTFAASNQVPTAPENRPINKGLVPGMYLGV
jgi:hypothetical protein